MAFGAAGLVNPVAAVFFQELAVLAENDVNRLAVEQHAIEVRNANGHRNGMVGSDLIDFPAREIVEKNLSLLARSGADEVQLVDKINPLASRELIFVNGGFDLV